MMPETAPQAADYARLVYNGSPSRSKGLVAAIAHGIGAFLQLAMIRRRESVDSGLLESRLG